MSCTRTGSNVLIVNQLGHLYGAEISLLEMVRVLDGFHPIVMTAGEGALGATLETNGVATFAYDFRRAPRLRSELTNSLRGILDVHAVDIVHLNKPHLSHTHRLRCIDALRRLTREMEIPMIVHVRSVEAPLNPTQMRLLGQMDKIVCVSHETKRELLEQRHAEQLRGIEDAIEVIYNGRTFQDYAFSGEKRSRIRDSLGIADSEFVVGLVGRFCSIKGQHRLIQLARRFQDSDNVRFLLVGDVMEAGDAAYKDRVMRRIKEHGLGNKVLWTGYVDGKEIMSGLDAVLSLSQTEGLPGVVIEAMAAGRCLVVNAVGGMPEMIGDGSAGYCVKKNDLPAMEKAIRRLQSDPSLARAMGEGARARAERLFTASRHGKEVTRIYDSLRRRSMSNEEQRRPPAERDAWPRSRQS